MRSQFLHIGTMLATAAAAALLLAGCAGGPSSDEKAADAALTSYLAGKADVTVASRSTPWAKSDGYGFLIRGTFSVRDTAPYPVIEAYYTKKKADGTWSVTLAGTGKDHGAQTVIEPNSDETFTVDVDKYPHRAVCYFLAAGSLAIGDEKSCAAVGD